MSHKKVDRNSIQTASKRAFTMGWALYDRRTLFTYSIPLECKFRPRKCPSRDQVGLRSRFLPGGIVEGECEADVSTMQIKYRTDLCKPKRRSSIFSLPRQPIRALGASRKVGTVADEAVDADESAPARSNFHTKVNDWLLPPA